MSIVKYRRYTYFVGLDVSKYKLDLVLVSGRKQLLHQVIPNEPQSIRASIAELKLSHGFTIAKAVFGMEQTGVYTQHLLAELKRARANIVLEDALHIKNSLGKQRGKYDKLDAIRIATYLYKTKDDLRLWEQRRPLMDQLAHLSTLRLRLTSIQKALKTPLKEQQQFLDVKVSSEHAELCSGSIEALTNDLRRVNRKIIEVVKSDTRLNRLFDIITSVPCIGPVTAVQIIITTNEYKDITDPKKYASYAGVAPFRKESGNVTAKAKVSPLANKRMKSLLHICALSAVSYPSDLRDYYLRKTQEEGKHKMAVLNAVRFKLLLRIFACLSQDRLYTTEFDRKASTSVQETS